MPVVVAPEMTDDQRISLLAQASAYGAYRGALTGVLAGLTVAAGIAVAVHYGPALVAVVRARLTR